MDYIERIKKIKSERKITNEQLSEMTGIPLGTLSKILAGISDSPKLVNVVAIADALGCTLDYIVSGVSENTNNYTLSTDEISLVENYRMLDTHGCELVKLVVQKELERVAPGAQKNRNTIIIPANQVARKMNYMDAAGTLASATLNQSAHVPRFSSLDFEGAKGLSLPKNVTTTASIAPSWITTSNIEENSSWNCAPRFCPMLKGRNSSSNIM